MNNCIFCQIVRGEIPCHKVYEDDNFLGFLDIRPLNKGHSLIVPKKHYRWTIDVPNFGDYWEAAGRVGRAANKVLLADSINFVTLGYEVPHAHIHVIPRFANDDLGSLLDWSKGKSFSEKEMKEIAEKIREEVCLPDANNRKSETRRYC